VFAEARCAVALGWDCEMIGAYADTNPTGQTHGHLDERLFEYIDKLAAQAEQAGTRLQFFVLGQSLEQRAEFWKMLAARGHALDQHTYSHVSLLASPEEEIAQQIRHTNHLFEEVLGFRPFGLRAPGGYKEGLEGLEAVQKIILQTGLCYVSSQYSTKSPSGKYDVVADKNAYMMIKHLQPRRYASGLWEIPMMGYSDRHWFDSLQRDLQGWIKHLQDCVDFAYDIGGLLFAPDLHPDTHAHYDPGLEVLPALFEHIQRKYEPVRIVTHREIAAALLQAQPRV